MWLKTPTGELVNLDHLAAIQLVETGSGQWCVRMHRAGGGEPIDCCVRDGREQVEVDLGVIVGQMEAGEPAPRAAPGNAVCGMPQAPPGAAAPPSDEVVNQFRRTLRYLGDYEAAHKTLEEKAAGSEDDDEAQAARFLLGRFMLHRQDGDPFHAAMARVLRYEHGG